MDTISSRRVHDHHCMEIITPTTALPPPAVKRRGVPPSPRQRAADGATLRCGGALFWGFRVSGGPRREGWRRTGGERAQRRRETWPRRGAPCHARARKNISRRR
eukprot:scaffold1658_cov393-Prasinococcus_capsulatus_cf.AAC.1